MSLCNRDSASIQHGRTSGSEDGDIQYIFPHSFDDYLWVRERLISATGSDSQESGRKIYVSRQLADRGRKVENHEEMMEELSSRGFESVIMESLPFCEQVKLMAESDVIVGPHGAGLVNMIFSDDPTVIELLPKTDLRPHFYSLSSVFGFDYQPIATKTNEENMLLVDVDKLCRSLDDYDEC